MEIKLKDFVDEKSFKDLQELDKTISSIKETYTTAARELAQGLTIEVKCKGDLDKLQNVYNTQMSNVASASESLTGVLKKQSEVTDQLMKKIKEKADAEKLSVKEVKELSKATAEASKAVQQAAKAEEAYNKAQKAANATRKSANMTEEERIRTIKEALALADKEIHSKEEAKEVNKRLRQATDILKDTDEDYINTLGKLNATIGVNTDYVKRNSDRYTQQKMTIGNYKEEVKAAWMELNNLNDSMSSLGIVGGSFGNSLGALGELGGMLEGAKGLVSVLSNKWLLGLGAGAVAGAGIGWWVNYNKGLVEATRLTQQFTEKSGDDLKEYRNEVQAIADFYNKDFKEVLIAANAVSKQFGIDASESIKLIQDGFIAGADANGEYLDTLREYPAYFKEAGISAEAFIAITAQAAKSGIYSDKGVDVIKEGNIRIREMTTATAAALEGIGISVDEVQKQLETGQKTTFDIMQMVSERLTELPDSAAVVGTAIADIFGGPGEDAGLQYIRTLKDIKTNLNEVKAATGRVGVAQEEYLESQKKLANELSELFDATGGSFEVMTSNIKSKWNDFLSYLIRGVNDVKDDIRLLVAGQDTMNSYNIRKAQEKGVANFTQKEMEEERKLLEESTESYIKQGYKFSEAQEKAREDRLMQLRKERNEIKRYENMNLQENLNISKEKDDANFFKQALFMQPSNSEYDSLLDSTYDSWLETISLGASHDARINFVSKLQYTGGSDIDAETEAEKEARLEAEKSLQESRIALMKDGLDKELATIRNGYQQKISEIKGNSAAELALRNSLQEEMNKALTDATEEYEKNRTDIDLQNRLAAVEEGSEEELSVRLEILDKQKKAEIKAAESNGADVSLIEQKYLEERRRLYEEYAADEVEEIAKSAAARQVVRNAQYTSELKELEKAFASGLIQREEYEKAKAEMTERFSVETASAAISSLEQQLEVEDLSADDREAIAEKLQKAKADLANAEADAEIAAIKRVADEEEKSYQKRMENARQWMEISSDAIGTIGGLMTAMYEGDINDIEEKQEANENAYNADVERIESLVESGVISTEEGEARKRAAEAETAKKNEELENEKVKLQQKQAKWQKGVDIAQAGIATALAITRALPNLVLAGIIAAMGAVQVATIAATPIPAYKDGTKNGGHIGGLAIVGDGGKQEIIVYGGKGWITPDTPTIIDLPKGAEVYPDVNTFESMSLNFTPLSETRENPVVVNDYSELSREMKGVRSELRKMARQQHRDAYNAKYESYKRNKL
jgi:hypothetical protein|nr:MAG TPA_asm: tail tape measure protein [Caudoviricetes sp.]